MAENNIDKKAERTKEILDFISKENKSKKKKNKNNRTKGILAGIDEEPSIEEKEAEKKEVAQQKQEIFNKNKIEKDTRSYYLRVEIINMLDEMFDRSELSKSEIVEVGIEAIYDKFFSQK